MSDAVRLYERLLDWSTKGNGMDFKNVAHDQYNLALAYAADGRFAESEQLFNSALQSLQKLAKSGSQEIEWLRFKIRRSLATMYAEESRLEEAMDLLDTMLTRLQKELGPSHPEMMKIRHDIAMLLMEQQEVDKAMSQLQDVYHRQCAILQKMTQNYCAPCAAWREVT